MTAASEGHHGKSPRVGGARPPHREDRAPLGPRGATGPGGFIARDKEAPARPGLQFPEESRPVVSQRRIGQL